MNTEQKMNEIMAKFEKQFEEVFKTAKLAAVYRQDLPAFEKAVERYENGVQLLRKFIEDGRLSMDKHGDYLVKMENAMMALRYYRSVMRQQAK